MRVVGGMDVDADNRVRTTFGHNPSSLRLCSFSPNLQNIPRTCGGIERYVKDMFVAPEGYLFWERDYAGIEAKLVGYFAGSKDYVIAATLGIHDFLCSHMLGRPADFNWPVEDLKLCFKEIKANHKVLRDAAKRIVHGSNYMMSPRRMHELYPESFPTIKSASDLQGLYFELFPAIRTWHKELANRVDGTKKRHREDVNPSGETGDGLDPWSLGVCFARNPFGYVHHFYNVLDWTKVDGKWYSSYGEDAKRLVSFLPQSTAAAIIKKAAKRIFYETPWIGNTVRLLIHDSILGECVEADVEKCLRVSQEIMEAPIEELPLDPSWGMGEYLVINTEAKVGKSWGEM